ncbi:aspartate/glutamate racemase family protein [Jeongeupia naejangsanensis]|uniref:Aspartate/glutamate racemase family protein n=1 Tax=Jeongeupia naejangsanensis TaxID=613195 RepID=A0ABS2BM11_9NEIS|nr:aspartate/glutamate racemase family protein [Jeongeupia naejangsanensis]MBM3116651.1 aspartate/glutamate racemase family protein [Jeongeupia naejangsanensis]
MKTIGLIGGMSWESTVVYYQEINRRVARRLGGMHSARIVVDSIDFAELVPLQERGDWEAAGALLAASARRLAAAGADVVLIGANTMHKVAADVEAATSLPLLHIADATAARLRAAGHTCIGLLGTRYTMEQAFYTGRLAEHGIEVLIPDTGGRERVHRVIYDELCKGVFSESGRTIYREEMAALATRGASAIVLGCTEIGLLVSAGDSRAPLFDTALIHAQAAADWALGT